jgi:hypothetical protein
VVLDSWLNESSTAVNASNDSKSPPSLHHLYLLISLFVYSRE